MSNFGSAGSGAGRDPGVVGAARDENERVWIAIALGGAMTVAEVVGGSRYGSLGLVADGLHMAAHAAAMLIAALTYTYARRHAADTRFAAGSGKLGDLANFASAIVLAMIALRIGYEAVLRFMSPVPIRFGEAIPIAVLGLLVNLASIGLLGGDDDGLEDEHGRDDDVHRIVGRAGVYDLRLAFSHVLADTAVSVLAIVGLLLARGLGWVWMDPLACLIGALVIANWSWNLMRDTGGVLLDMNLDRRMAENVRHVIEHHGDTVLGLDVSRVGPGQVSAIVAVAANRPHAALSGSSG
ncbi:MAG TPA: CDF family Co(II)/Ni(II) efflux transporter DmeF [Paraburkholderia sp.]|nr:CDF family Co(II)/Ni(II) efflux transporter DmeF [Paraburkholderia sp.]